MKIEASDIRKITAKMNNMVHSWLIIKSLARSSFSNFDNFMVLSWISCGNMFAPAKIASYFQYIREVTITV